MSDKDYTPKDIFDQMALAKGDTEFVANRNILRKEISRKIFMKSEKAYRRIDREKQHSVRWAVGIEPDTYQKVLRYSKWHYTTNASDTLCGAKIPVIKFDMLPETEDGTEKVNCRRCKKILKRK